MKRSIPNLFGLLLAGALAACGSKDDDTAASNAVFVPSKNNVFHASVEWPEALKAGQGIDNKAVVTILKADDSVPSEVELTAFHPRMPAHGHGTNEGTQKITARTDTPNVFDVTGIVFIMAGETATWVTDLVAKVDGETDEVQIPISREVE